MNLTQEKIKKAGYKLTKPRLSILGILKKHKLPISAKEIYKKVKNIDLASIYRTLNIFESLNIVNIENRMGKKLYCLAEVQHHHIFCEKCEYIEEIRCNHFFKKVKNFTNINHQLTLTGICNSCNK